MVQIQQETVKYVIRTPEDGWRITGTRVSLDSVVYLYREGADPETIVLEFPSISLEQAHGVIAFYLRNRKAVEHYLCDQKHRADELRAESEKKHRALLERLRAERALRDTNSGTAP